MARMDLPVIDNFFTFNLKKGCIVMGIMNAVISLILAIVLFCSDEIKEPADLKRGGDETDAMSSVVYTIVVVQIVLLTVKTFLDLVLAYAAYKEKTGVVKRYCIFWTIFLVLFIIGFLKTLFHMDFLPVIAQVIFLGENFYYIVVIRSFLISINEDGVL